MRKVRVVSQKYDGSPRDEYETYLFMETDEGICLFSPPGLGYWDYRKAARLEAQDGLLELYFRHKSYNVWHICKQVSNINLTYVNITMPASLCENTLVWTDLDLDYRLHLNHTIERLDQEEFEHNATRMSYPEDLLEQVRKACQEVEAGLVSGTYPFDYSQQVELYQRIKRLLYHTPNKI
jgi:protein associated with RNAse G/E